MGAANDDNDDCGGNGDSDDPRCGILVEMVLSELR